MLGWYPREDQILSGPLSTSSPKEGPWARVGGAALSFKIYRFKQQKWSQRCVGDPRHPFLCAMLCGRLQLRASLKREAQRLRAKAGLVNTQAHKWLSDPQAARTRSGFPGTLHRTFHTIFLNVWKPSPSGIVASRYVMSPDQHKDQTTDNGGYMS